MKNKGFTLIEVLITTGIMAIVGGLMTGIFYTVTSVNQRETASGEVTSQLNFVTQTIQRLVRESSNIEIEAGTATTTLKLRMADSAKDPTCISFVSSTIRIAEGPDGTNPENCTSNVTDLTSNKVTVDSLNFKKFTQYPGHDTVSFDVAMTYVSGDPAAQVQRTLQSAIARVSAATFDANLLPGDTTYTVGQVGSTWQNIFAADGTAANPSYTFGSDTGLGLFRGGSNILGFSTAGLERLRIDASGYVGVGTTTPSTIFTVAGTSTFAGNINLAGATSTYRITNVASPVSGSDVATKAYVDAASAATTTSSFPAGYVARFTSSDAVSGWTYLNAKEDSTSIGDNTWATKTSLATLRGRYSLTAVTVNNKVYAIAGEVADGSQRQYVDEYDPSADSWTIKGNMLANGVNGGAVCEGTAINDKIYIMGGKAYSAIYSTSTQEYTPSTDTWVNKANMPTARNLCGAGVVNGKIYVIGGYNTTGNLATNEEYDPVANTWATKTSMPTARNDSASAVVDSKIYVIGGNSSSVSAKNEVYTPSTDSWATKTNMTTARSGPTSAVVGGRIYVIGGYITDGVATNEMYDPDSDTWTTKTNMTTARAYPAGAAVGNKIYVIGGATISSTNKTTNEQYQAPTTYYLFSKD